MSNTPTPQEHNKDTGFVFGDPNDNAPNKITALAGVNAYLVAYTDGAGQKSVRLAFRVPGSETTFLLQEKIQGSFVATAGTAWFNKAMIQSLKTQGLEKEEGEGAEGAAQL